MARKSGDTVAKELEDIKRLLILSLIRGGTANQEEIAKALGVSQSSISRMFPGGIGKAEKPRG